MPSALLSQLDDNDTNVFQKSLIDRYQRRPLDLQSMCLAEFAASYVVKYSKSDESDCEMHYQLLRVIPLPLR